MSWKSRDARNSAPTVEWSESLGDSACTAHPGDAGTPLRRCVQWGSEQIAINLAGYKAQQGLETGKNTMGPLLR